MAEEKHRESLLVALDHIQAYFLNCLRTTDNIECKQARDYAYGRWPEEFCSVAGIGYAPIDGNLFVDYCQKGRLMKKHSLSWECLNVERTDTFMPCFGNES